MLQLMVQQTQIFSQSIRSGDKIKNSKSKFDRCQEKNSLFCTLG
jgi:hypothetical protein